MKRIIAIILTLSVCLTCIPSVFAFSEETIAQKENIYLSDLFYGYQYYLQNSQILDDFNNGNIEEFNRVINQFIDSDEGNKTLYKKAFETMTSPTDFVNLLSDISGRTDFTHQNALNDANAYFAQNVLGAENRQSDLDEVDDYQDYYDRLDEFSTFSKEFLESHKLGDYSYDALLSESLAFLKKYDIIENSYIFSVEGKLTSDLDYLNDLAEVTGDAFEAVEVIILSLIIEDVRIDRIKLLMNYSNDGILKEGMTKLYNQMKQGFTEYFAENYIKKNILEKIADEVDDFIVDGVLTVAVGGWAGLVSALIDVGITVVFDIILNAKDIDDVITQIYLTDYCNCMYDAVMNYSKNFSNQFSPAQVEEYKNLVNLYGTAIEITQDYSEDFLLSFSGGHGFAVYPSLEGYEDLFGFLVSKTMDALREIPVESREMYYYQNWIIGENSKYSMGSNELEENTLYFVKGLFNGNIRINSSTGFEINDDVTLNGNVVLFTELSVESNGDVTVNGDLIFSEYHTLLENKGNVLINGNLKHASGHFATIVNDSLLQVKGDITACGRIHTFTNNGTLKVGGSIYLDLTGGSLVLNGSQLQEIYNVNVKNLSVENTSGVKLHTNIYVSGEYYLNGNNIDCNGFNCVVNSETEFDSVSDYKNITVAANSDLTVENPITFESMSVSGESTVTFKDKVLVTSNVILLGTSTVIADSDMNIMGNISLSANSAKFIVNENKNVYINGNLILGEYYARLENKGNIFINGNLKHSSGHYAAIVNDSLLEIKGDVTECGRYNSFTNNGTLKVGGKFQLTLTGGSLVLNGTQPQEVYNVNVKNLSVENTSGVKLLSNIYVSGKYYLNGNNIDCNGFNCVVNSETEFDSVSNYKNITVSAKSDLTIKNPITFDNMNILGESTVNFKGTAIVNNNISVTGNSVVIADSDMNIMGNISLSANSAKFIVNENKNVYINGNLILGEYYARLENKGNIFINGNLKHSSGHYATIVNDTLLQVKGDISACGRIHTFTNNGTLKVGGNVYLDLTGGKVILNGQGLQNVNVLNVDYLTVENDSTQGVFFNTAITVKELFNHKGNKFALYKNGAGSTFNDYDGDGKNDNIDVDPVNYTFYYDYESVCDINNDKSTNILDLIKIKKIVSEEQNETSADIITDGKIDAQDMLVVKKYLLSDYSFFDTLNS